MLDNRNCDLRVRALPIHDGKRVVLIRVLRFLESDPIRPDPDYTGPEYPPELIPREGQHLMRLRYRRIEPWAEDVDTVRCRGRGNPAEGLSTLFENERVYGPYEGHGHS